MKGSFTKVSCRARVTFNTTYLPIILTLNLGERKFKNEDFYKGDFYKDFLHGKGELIQKDGNRYIGDFAADSRTGQGKYFMKNGDVYEGEFVENEMKGKGFLKTSEIEYRGDFKEGKPNGRGVLLYGDDLKLKHEGYFKHGVKHGKGYFTTKENKIYITTWYQGRKDGRFFLKSPNGSIAEGLFKNDEIVGDITTKFINGDIYVGNSINAYREGKGRMVWANHPTLKTYEGNFEKNKMHGKGLLTLRNGMIYEGNMYENKMHGSGELRTRSYVAIGEFHFGKPQGNFVVVYSNDDEYTGTFDNFKRNGQGRMIWSQSGNVFEGGWLNNKKHGLGKFLTGDLVFEGKWIQNKRDGAFKIFNNSLDQEFRAFYKRGEKIEDESKMPLQEIGEQKEQEEESDFEIKKLNLLGEND